MVPSIIYLNEIVTNSEQVITWTNKCSLPGLQLYLVLYVRKACFLQIWNLQLFEITEYLTNLQLGSNPFIIRVEDYHTISSCCYTLSKYTISCNLYHNFDRLGSRIQSITVTDNIQFVFAHLSWIESCDFLLLCFGMIYC